jgi:hypothetical protein
MKKITDKLAVISIFCSVFLIITISIDYLKNAIEQDNKLRELVIQQQDLPKQIKRDCICK